MSVRVLVFIMFFVSAFPAAGKVKDLLPKPQCIEMGRKGKTFKMQRPVVLADSTHNALLRNFLISSGCRLVDKARARVEVELVDTLPNTFDYPLYGFPFEGYALKVMPDLIEIKAANSLGVTRAVQTLVQMAEGERTKNVQLETVSILDWPAFKLRGVMHDVGRSFIDVDELKREIDLLSRFKINVFHWHLTENLAWRFQVKAYPQLTDKRYAKRYAGQYYSQEACAELEKFAAERGVMIIPEIDMPGHSEVFSRSMGFDMQSEAGRRALKVILKEVGRTFTRAPYIHIGGDEVTVQPGFLEEMAQFVRDSLKRKVIVWNPIRGVKIDKRIADMTQMWSTAGRAVETVPNIDCRYNYVNHFDVYADVVGIYKSNVYYAQRGSATLAGAVSAVWNDTKVASQKEIIMQNNFYANALATAERTWRGGGKEYVEQGGTTLPGEGDELQAFEDFERRFLFHKAHALCREPIAYVKQSQVKWCVSAPFPNNGDASAVFPPETCKDDVLPQAFGYNGKTYQTKMATGAGVYLRHIWHPVVPSFLKNPGNGQTVYAWTYVYSPKRQTLGAQVEFYTYSRSGNEYAPKANAWDRRGSRLWINGEEIPAPRWLQTDVPILQDQPFTGLLNENLTARPLTLIHLNKGWNKVFLKLPHADNGGTARDKWQFTFVITTLDGREAAEGLVYSPFKHR